MKIQLSRKQVKTLIDIYNHFRNIEKFNIIFEDDTVYVGIDLFDGSAKVNVVKNHSA